MDIGLDMLCHLSFFQRVESKLLSLVCVCELLVVYHVCELSVMPLLFLADYLAGVYYLPPHNVSPELLLQLV